MSATGNLCALSRHDTLEYLQIDDATFCSMEEVVQKLQPLNNLQVLALNDMKLSTCRCLWLSASVLVNVVKGMKRMKKYH
jgi:hypothetical protein